MKRIMCFLPQLQFRGSCGSSDGWGISTVYGDVSALMLHSKSEIASTYMAISSKLQVRSALASGGDVEEYGLVALVDFLRVANALLLRNNLIMHNLG